MAGGIIPVGSELAVCVQTEAGFGVVCLDNQIHCVTCKFGTTSRAHVTCIHQTITSYTDDEGMIEFLKPFLEFVSTVAQGPAAGESPSKGYLATNCLSANLIPFDFTPSLKSIIKTDTRDCFRIGDEGIAQLVPQLPSLQKCPVCNSSNSWSEEIFLKQESVLITCHQSLKAKGMFI